MPVRYLVHFFTYQPIKLLFSSDTKGFFRYAISDFEKPPIYPKVRHPLWMPLVIESTAKYSNTSQTRVSKVAKFSNSRFLLLFFTSKLAVPLLSTQIRDFCYFLSPKNREFGGITVNGRWKKFFSGKILKKWVHIWCQHINKNEPIIGINFEIVRQKVNIIYLGLFRGFLIQNF